MTAAEQSVRPATRPKREYVFCERVRCPGCGATKLRTYRSTKSSDGSLARHTVCRVCGKKFVVVLE